MKADSLSNDRDFFPSKVVAQFFKNSFSLIFHILSRSAQTSDLAVLTPMGKGDGLLSLKKLF